MTRIVLHFLEFIHFIYTIYYYLTKKYQIYLLRTGIYLNCRKIPLRNDNSSRVPLNNSSTIERSPYYMALSCRKLPANISYLDYYHFKKRIKVCLSPKPFYSTDEYFLTVCQFFYESDQNVTADFNDFVTVVLCV